MKLFKSNGFLKKMIMRIVSRPEKKQTSTTHALLMASMYVRLAASNVADATFIFFLLLAPAPDGPDGGPDGGLFARPPFRSDRSGESRRRASPFCSITWHRTTPSVRPEFNAHPECQHPGSGIPVQEAGCHGVERNWHLALSIKCDYHIVVYIVNCKLRSVWQEITSEVLRDLSILESRSTLLMVLILVV